MSGRERPEVLAPAGNWEALRAAVANGADAVYFGLSNFNARHRATNFSLEELPQVMDFLHERNVRGYVTCNTLIFSEELPELVEYVRRLNESRVDAVIVQDLGLAQLIHRMAPGLPIHGSTQMTLTEPRGIGFVEGLGVERVILARELTLEEIGKITGAVKIPVEVFVHGALCIAYSGQCLTSEALGGRSANRGECAQACRLPYDLIVDGKHQDLGEQNYLVSPQDLAAPDLIDDLVKLGVHSFKIEGRLKSPQYVAATTQAYRKALDTSLAGRQLHWTETEQRELAQSFSRGLSHGFLGGLNHQTLVPGLFPKSRGVKLGSVVKKTSCGVVIELAPEVPLGVQGLPAIVREGDGIVFDEGHPDQDEQGGRIYRVDPVPGKPREVELTFGPQHLNLAALSIGCLVWKTDDPALRKRLEQSYNRDIRVHRRPLDVTVQGTIGEKLITTWRADRGPEIMIEWPGPLQLAQKHPLSRATLREQFGRLGDSPYELRDITLIDSSDGETLPAMVPKSVLNDLRRQALEQLQHAEAADTTRSRPVNLNALSDLRAEIAAIQIPATVAEPQLYVLVRSLEQLQGLLDWTPPDNLPGPAAVYCDFEDIRRYEAAVKLARESAIRIGLATIRVAKPFEEGWMRQIGSYAPDIVLIRNFASLSYFKEQHPEIQLVGDYSLNVSNELTASLFFEQGFIRQVPSYDLNWKQLQALLRNFPAAWFEQVVHQHMPMFHMEHCVFAATLSDGKDYRDCGRPCEHHQVELRDRRGELHPLLADVGCRNTLYNSMAQSATEYIPRMLELGLRHFRVELLREHPREIKTLLDRYARAIAGKQTGKTVWRELRVLDQLGVTRGTLDFS